MRKYYIITLTFALGLFLSNCTQSKENREENVDNVNAKKNIYLQLYSVRDAIGADFQATIEKVAEAGYTGVEAAGYKDGQFYGMSPEDFKSAIEKVGLEVLSSHAGRPLDTDLGKTDWSAVWAWWDTAIDAHKKAGMKYIVMPWMPEPKSLEDLKQYCDYYNKIGEKCSDAGLKFGYHNHNFEYKEIEGKLIYDYMLENTDPDKVFFQMDVYWTTRGDRNPVDYFNNYPNRFKLLHIKDEKEIAGEGSIMDFDNLFQNMDNAGVENIIVEVEKYNLDPLESIKVSIDYLLNNDNVKAKY